MSLNFKNSYYTLICFLFFLFPFFSWSQSVLYVNSGYEWDTSMNRKIPVNPIFENEDAVILSRKIYYKSTGFLEKTERVLLKTQKGVDYFTHMYLPENQERLVNPDMKNISHNLSSQFRFYNDFEVKYFCVRIIRPNGHTFTPEVRYTPIRDSIRINNNSLIRIRMFFNFSPLKVGDELQYSYKISV